jgi:hypothetical protein
MSFMLYMSTGLPHRHTFMTELHWCNLLQGGSKGVPRRFTPILKGVREEVQDGMYTLVSGAAGRDTSCCPCASSGHRISSHQHFCAYE